MDRDDPSDLPHRLDAARGRTAGLGGEIRAATRAMREMEAQSTRLSRTLGSALGRAFERAVVDGRRFGDVMRGLVADIGGRVLDSALRPVEKAAGSGLGRVVGGLTGALGSLFGARTPVVPTALSGTGGFGGLPGLAAFGKGGVIDAGHVRAFADGGVFSGGLVRGPTLFPMARGTGLMGEAGPEAILPLSRGPDGRLGVEAGGVAKGAPPVVNIRIETPDVEGFRRSRGQVTGELARAVARGNRRL